jgi:hypothetical protein
VKRHYAALFFIAALAFFASAFPVHAARLNFVSDTITDSRPNWPADHKVVFGVPSGVPANGQIVVAFEGNPFLIDPSFSFNDVDVSVSPDSPYTDFVEQNVAANADATDDGVLVDQVNGKITITISSGSGIPAGSYVQLLFGDNASFGSAGSFQITNPTSTGSYRILLNTYSAVSFKRIAVGNYSFERERCFGFVEHRRVFKLPLRNIVWRELRCNDK